MAPLNLDLQWLESMAKFASKTSDRKGAQKLLDQLRSHEALQQCCGESLHEKDE